MVTIQVCVGSACHLKGSYDVIKSIQKLIEVHDVSNEIELKGAFCLGRCVEGVSVKVDAEDIIFSVNEGNVDAFFKEQVLGRIQK